ncbi:MAG TPA: hypothetical protein VKP30_02505 [Polyangiaceae bacterium]|nr:hypothetical protein [Polyangiaceae bacterium]
MLSQVVPLVLESAGAEQSGSSSCNSTVMAQGERLSRSALWTLQRACFNQAGVNAWRTGQVPHYITSNPFMAAAYARVVTGFLRDLAAANSCARGDPLTIVELGAGSGRLAFHFLQKLLAERRVAARRADPLRYDGRCAREPSVLARAPAAAAVLRRRCPRCGLVRRRAR